MGRGEDTGMTLEHGWQLQAGRRGGIVAPAVGPEGAGHTAGNVFVLALKHRDGDLLPDLDFVRIGNIARSGNVRIMIGRPIKAVAYLR